MYPYQSKVLSHNTTSSVALHRKAINSCGSIGSFYDSYRDCVLLKDSRNVPRQSNKSLGLAESRYMGPRSKASRNLLRSIGIENDLRLSLLLNLTSKIGIAAVLNHPYQMNEHMRFLHYSWVDREEQVSDEVMRSLTSGDPIKSTSTATHVVTGVTYGIDLLAVLQLPTESDFIMDIDQILYRISSYLSHGNDIVSVLTNEEHDRLRQIIKVTVYSNIRDLTGVNNMSTLLHQIQAIKKNPNNCAPIKYFLQPLTILDSQHIRHDVTFHTLPTDVSDDLENYIYERRALVTNLTVSFQDDVQRHLSGYLEAKLQSAHIQSLHLIQKYMAETERLSELLVDFRSDRVPISAITNVLTDKHLTTLKTDSDELVASLHDLEAKANFINDLLSQNFSYCNVAEHDINKNDTITTIKAKLNVIDGRDRVLCSDDTLNKQNRDKFNRLNNQLVEERHRNRDLRLIYADFTYSSYKLNDMDILSIPNQRDYDNIPQRTLNTRFRKVTPPPPPLPPPRKQPSVSEAPKSFYLSSSSLNDEFINILLVGETGVGKSTFINAFANYLKFTSMERAESHEPIAVIPVSFTLPVGDRFEEHTVKFGNINSSNAENFNNVGQSVTQHCKSYVFTLNNPQRRKVRIIDTPGFGDARGLDQDDRNIEHILQYINNLTHLNAICFLLKPNITQLNISFRTCLVRLMSLLGPTAHNNVLFCFTNARSTLFTSGNTVPLLKNMLATSSLSGISVTKDNIFCLDNESFRYLIARHNRIPFHNKERQEYEHSWLTSVNESNRLMDYICQYCNPFHIRGGAQSIKHAEFEISRMVRPILETIRNTLRNIILHKRNLSHLSIELCPKSVTRPTAICFSCKRDMTYMSHFWITSDSPHDFQTKCQTCSCTPSYHIPINYTLEYRVKSQQSTYPFNDTTNMLHNLINASAEFSHFLIHGARSSNDDPFLLGLMRMIRKEKVICSEKESSEFNTELMAELEKVQQEYEQRKREAESNQDRKTLGMVYEKMKIIRNYHGIHEQMLAGDQSQEAIMKQHDIIV